MTPEAAVFDGAGASRTTAASTTATWTSASIGRRPTTHDLADALTAVLAGAPVSRPAVPAVGCTIVRHRP